MEPTVPPQSGEPMPFPLVSVVIPTRNRPALLARAVESVRTQTYRQLEILVVDDGSTDETREAVAAWADPRIRYLRHATNRGGSAARNTGIAAATGAYIAFLDDDDEWVADKVTQQLEAMRDADAVLCTAVLNGRRCGPRGSRPRIDVHDLRRAKFTGGGTGVLMARADVMKRLRFDEALPRCQDWDMFIRLGQQYRVAYLDKALVRYNEGQHARISNEIVGMSVVELEKRLRILHKHRDFFGPRWFNYHRAGFMLYAIRHRRDRVRHLLRVINECGPVAVGRAVGIRISQIMKTLSAPELLPPTSGCSKVSVVIATFNRASLLKRAINSALTQSYRNLELIVVDDGSADGTQAVVASIADERVRYIRHEHNRGLAAAGRNTGIDAARGEFIAFLDDDDEWLPDKIARQVEAIASYEAVVCAARLNRRRVRRYRKRFVSLRELKRGNRFPPSGLMARAEILRALRFDELLRIGEDWDLLIRLAERKPVVYLDEPLFIYHDDTPHGMTTQARNQPIHELEKRMAVIRKHAGLLGRFWVNYHVAGFLLSYLRVRSDKRSQILYAIRRCGWIAVGAALGEKFIRRIEAL